MINFTSLKLKTGVWNILTEDKNEKSHRFGVNICKRHIWYGLLSKIYEELLKLHHMTSGKHIYIYIYFLSDTPYISIRLVQIQNWQYQMLAIGMLSHNWKGCKMGYPLWYPISFVIGRFLQNWHTFYCTTQQFHSLVFTQRSWKCPQKTLQTDVQSSFIQCS